MTAPQPAHDGEVCACGHDETDHGVTAVGCIHCPCSTPCPAAPSEPPAADNPTAGTCRWRPCWCPESTELCAFVPPPDERDALAERLAAVGTRPGFAEQPAWARWTQFADAALAARPSADTETLRERIEALEASYRANGEQREALGKPAWPLNVARDLRAALDAR